MRIRKAIGLVIAAALGAATVVLPAAAGSEGSPPTVAAENVGLYNHYWTPPSVRIEPGGTVEFSNPTEVPHGIRWVSAPAGAPGCAAGVPVGTTASASGTNWKGACTFAAAGTYTYYCTVHGAAMSGTITVGTTTTGTTTGTTTTTTTPPTTSTGAPPSTTGDGAPATAALSALKLASARRGAAVRGSVEVSSSAAGGTLTVALSAKLDGKRVQVGHSSRAYVSAGVQAWSVSLSSRARRALRSRHRLLVSARISLTPPGGSPTALTRTLTLHS